jgi:glycosyltransferase involved in cell wall biosynthesis
MIVGCFGFVNANKRPDKLMEAICTLKTEGYPTKLVFFGECTDDNILNSIRENGLENDVFITGFLSKSQYLAGMKIVDVVVNLRYPSMGEASATLFEAFYFGKSVIVSNIGQYKEFPDDICWKADVNSHEVPQLVAMLQYLFENKEARAVLGENAKRYADNVLNPKKIAQMYYDVL